MNFGSKYVYAYPDSEEESISDDEFEGGLNLEREEEERGVVGVKADGPTPAGATNDSVNSKSPLMPKSKKVSHWMLTSNCKKSKSGSKDEKAADQEPCSSDQKNATGKVGWKKWRRADTNVIAVKFDNLTVASKMHTGDPVVCNGCKAMLSHLSTIDGIAEEKMWRCEFCESSNHVDIELEEIPAEQDVTYMIEPAPSTSSAGKQGGDQSLVVFCVDISGSMCATQEVPGKLKLRGNHEDRFRSLNTEGENQWLPRQNRNVTYISRLQGLQAAVDHQLEDLAKDHPHRRAALVTFNNEVTVIGDGRMTPVSVAGDRLVSIDELTQIGSNMALPVSVQDSRAMLGKKVFDLEEGGQTALGPALLVSVAMAGQVSGSKVIICTDGLANLGIGSLESGDSTENIDKATNFYKHVAELANSKGVSVSVLTIAGTNCKLVELGHVANETGGQVNIVDPLKLTQEFGNILSNPVIASKVVATFHVHNGLYIRDAADRASRIVREIGNVTKDSEITFEYGVRASYVKEMEAAGMTSSSVDSQATNLEAGQTPKDSDAAFVGGTGEPNQEIDHHDEQTPDSMEVDKPCASTTKQEVKQKTELPFQVQIQYTDLDGAKALRVITQSKPITTERSRAETHMNMPVIGAHAAQKSSRFALEGAYTPSRLNAFMYQRLFARSTTSNDDNSNGYRTYVNAMAPLDRHLLAVQNEEAASRGSSVSRYEEAGDEESNRVTERRRRCTDLAAKEIYNKSKINSKFFKK